MVTVGRLGRRLTFLWTISHSILDEVVQVFMTVVCTYSVWSWPWIVLVVDRVWVSVICSTDHSLLEVRCDSNMLVLVRLLLSVEDVFLGSNWAWLVRTGTWTSCWSSLTILHKVNTPLCSALLGLTVSFCFKSWGIAQCLQGVFSESQASMSRLKFDNLGDRFRSELNLAASVDQQVANG